MEGSALNRRCLCFAHTPTPACSNVLIRPDPSRRACLPDKSPLLPAAAETRAEKPYLTPPRCCVPSRRHDDHKPPFGLNRCKYRVQSLHGWLTSREGYTVTALLSIVCPSLFHLSDIFANLQLAIMPARTRSGASTPVPTQPASPSAPNPGSASKASTTALEEKQQLGTPSAAQRSVRPRTGSRTRTLEDVYDAK